MIPRPDIAKWQKHVQKVHTIVLPNLSQFPPRFYYTNRPIS